MLPIGCIFFGFQNSLGHHYWPRRLMAGPEIEQGKNTEKEKPGPIMSGCQAFPLAA
jgi:hypothetical protein